MKMGHNKGGEVCGSSEQGHGLIGLLRRMDESGVVGIVVLAVAVNRRTDSDHPAPVLLDPMRPGLRGVNVIFLLTDIINQGSPLLLEGERSMCQSAHFPVNDVVGFSCDFFLYAVF